MGSERDIDDAIDRAVRDIMSAEPPAGLRRRVLERIERPSAGLSGWLQPAAAAAVLAVVLLAVLFMRPQPEREAPSQAASQSAPAPAPHAPAPPERERSLPREDAARPSVAVADPVLAGAHRPAARPSAPPPAAEVNFPEPGVVSAATVAGARAEEVMTPEPFLVPLDPDAEPIVIEAIRIAPVTIAPVVLRPIGSGR